MTVVVVTVLRDAGSKLYEPGSGPMGGGSRLGRAGSSVCGLYSGVFKSMQAMCMYNVVYCQFYAIATHRGY